jgi:hypothetical protein
MSKYPASGPIPTDHPLLFRGKRVKVEALIFNGRTVYRVKPKRSEP